MNNKQRKILCISVHPDDETLGCGGSLLWHKEQGDAVHWLIVSETYEPEWTRESIDAKAEEVSKVAEAYAMDSVQKLGFPAAKLDAVAQSELILRIRDVVDAVKPELVYLIHSGDVHSDHRVVFSAAMSVLKPFYMEKLGVEKILSYETLSSTEAAPAGAATPFVPNALRDISKYMSKKLEIMNLYKTEKQEEFFPRSESSIKALGRYRGSAISVEYAEAFVIIREVL